MSSSSAISDLAIFRAATVVAHRMCMSMPQALVAPIS